MKRIVFIAIVAYLDRPTRDGRTLVSPEEGVALRRTHAIPVFGWRDSGKRDLTGVIESAAVCDNRLIVFGRLFTGVLAQSYTDALASGTSWLEIDVDREVTETDDSTYPVTVRMTSWRLTAAHIGKSPCWDLPPTQIEEIRNA